MSITFGPKAAKRIANAVRKVEGAPTDATGTRVTPTPFLNSFWAELTDESDPGRYAWRMLVPLHGELTERDPVVEDAEFYSATEINGASGLTGQRVLLFFVGYSDPGPAYDTLSTEEYDELSVDDYDTMEVHPERRTRYIFAAGSGVGTFEAVCTNHVRDGANWRWTYTMQRVEFDGSSWETVGDPFTAQNRLEMMNTTGGLTGAGINLDNLDIDCELQPLPIGAQIEVTARPWASGSEAGIAYLFTHENSVDETGLSIGSD